MKALILAAGFGTRLAPHTNHLPKALFPLDGIPVLARMIDNLKRAGCSEIAVNTHHLANQVEAYLHEHEFGIPITISHEPDILGTGGAIRHLERFWDDRPFIVVNADIVTDIDLAHAYRTHLAEASPATLVLHDRPPFNRVFIDEADRIIGFERFAEADGHQDRKRLAFTGIHVMDRRILPWLPESGFCDIIAVYDRMIKSGQHIHAHIAQGHYWQDMGTPQRFRDAVVDAIAPRAFESAFPGAQTNRIERHRLKGDGSDRQWFRLTSDNRCLILADHGLTPDPEGSEVNAFVNIGRHLRTSGLPVPEIVAADAFSGLAFVEDLGDVHLQQAISQTQNQEAIEARYKKIIDTWLDLTENAGPGFNTKWTYQTKAYDADLIVEKECRYFVDAFLVGYLGLDVYFEDLAMEFERLAEQTLTVGVPGMIHRDFQSRNVMLFGGQHYLIDFQGARLGPIQYDLASLLIDPYVGIDDALQSILLNYAADQASLRLKCKASSFVQGYRYCAVTRNLQMLGAFGFLTRAKGKQEFEAWIPRAAAMLTKHIRLADENAFPRLLSIATTIGELVKNHHPGEFVKRK